MLQPSQASPGLLSAVCVVAVCQMVQRGCGKAKAALRQAAGILLAQGSHDGLPSQVPHKPTAIHIWQVWSRGWRENVGLS